MGLFSTSVRRAGRKFSKFGRPAPSPGPQPAHRLTTRLHRICADVVSSVNSNLSEASPPRVCAEPSGRLLAVDHPWNAELVNEPAETKRPKCFLELGQSDPQVK